MSSRRIQHKRSSVAGAVPDPSTLDVGEIAINFPDRYIYTKNGANAVIRLSGYIPLTQPDDERPGDTYINTVSGKMFTYYSLAGGGNAWHEIAPPEDLSPYVPLLGGTMSGPVIVYGTAAGNEGIGYNQVVNLIDAATADYIHKDGSIPMEGPLTLVATPPTNDLHAASKAYVDAAVVIATPDLSGYLPKTGGVMTGPINLPGGAIGNEAASATDLATSLATHVAAPDPHPQYLTDTAFAAHVAAGGAQHPAVTTTVNGFMGAADKTKLDALIPATDADIDTGTDTAKYVSPAGLAHYTDTAIFTTAREKLIANRTYYVRTDGVDTNDGLTDAAGGAFLTWQKAVDKAAALDFDGRVVTIKCTQAGVTFAAGATIPQLVGVDGPENLIIQGNPASPSSVTISVAAGTHCFKADGGQCVIQGFTFVLTADALAGMLRAEKGGHIEQQANVFGVLTPGGQTVAHMLAFAFGQITTIGDYAISGAAQAHLRALDLGLIDCIAHTCTIIGTPAFTQFAIAQIVSSIDYAFGATFSGAPTGSRYAAQSNSVIRVPPPGSATFFPGNATGTTSTNGVYTS